MRHLWDFLCTRITNKYDFFLLQQLYFESVINIIIYKLRCTFQNKCFVCSWTHGVMLSIPSLAVSDSDGWNRDWPVRPRNCPWCPRSLTSSCTSTRLISKSCGVPFTIRFVKHNKFLLLHSYICHKWLLNLLILLILLSSLLIFNYLRHQRGNIYSWLYHAFWTILYLILFYSCIFLYNFFK